LTELGVGAEVLSLISAPEITKVRIEKGDLLITYVTHAKTTYRLINTSRTDERNLTVWHIDDGEWRTISTGNREAPPKSRFSLRLAPGTSGSIEVHSERQQVVTLSATLIPIDDLEKLVANPKVSERVRDALKNVLNYRSVLNEDRFQMADLEKRLKEIGEDQDRLRKNIASLPPTSAAHKRYLQKFDAQETEIEGIQEQLKKTKEVAKQKLNELTDLLINLTID
jgi:hypothetical protein